MVKIGIYYVSSNLGHFRTVFNLIKGIKLHFKKKVSILIFQSEKNSSDLPFSCYARVCFLPDLPKNGLGLENKKGPQVQELFFEVLKKRISKTTTVLKEFSPDIFLTEFYPFGRDKWSRELPYVLKYIKRNLDSKIFASISYLIWKDKAFDILKEFYDGIFCHFPRDYLEEYLRSDYASRQGKEQFKKIMRHFSKSLYFTGFVLDRRLLDSVKNKEENNILVSRGGCKEKDKKDIILCSLKTARYFPAYNFIFSLGLYSDSKEVDLYHRLVKDNNNVRLERHIDNFCQLSARSVLNISMAGYNTVTELLYLGKKCVIFPYHTEEQLFRTFFINKKYRVSVIFSERLSVGALGKAIKKELKKSKKLEINRANFQGQKEFLKVVKTLI